MSAEHDETLSSEAEQNAIALYGAASNLDTAGFGAMWQTLTDAQRAGAAYILAYRIGALVKTMGLDERVFLELWRNT